MFELLFKYPAEAFAGGRLELAAPGWLAALAVAAAAVLLSHNISALMVAPVALAFGLWRVWDAPRSGARASHLARDGVPVGVGQPTLLIGGLTVGGAAA